MSEPICPNSVQVIWSDESQTERFAVQLAQALQKLLPCTGGISISLAGDLGAGKTTLVRYLLRALGISGRIKSPSYAIVESYETDAFPIWHCDFYRMNSAEEWEDAGFRDMFASTGLRLVEWPQQVPEGLVRYDLHLQWTLDATETRHINLQAGSDAGLQLLRNLEHER
jgi:tRNA threonylcarbamoyladenosine biosynthesis protein TsaE